MDTGTENLSTLASGVADRPQLRGWFHLVAAVLAVVVAPVMIALAPDGTRALAALYALGVVAVLGVSGFYHRVFWSTRLRSFMRSLDHSMIFVFIAATYTPMSVATLDGDALVAILGVVWGGAAVGIVMRLTWPQAPTWLVAVPYLVVGWAIIPVLDRVLDGLGPGGFSLLMTGGALYTLGAGVYALGRPDPWPARFGFHEVFHVLVLAAIATHYVAVAVFALPLAGE